MQYVRLKNWSEHQHYRDREPPWVKLHRKILQSPTWVTASDADRVLAISIILLAAATSNRIPADPVYLQRVACLNSTPDLSFLLSMEFIEIVDHSGNASTLQADASKTLLRGRDRDRTPYLSPSETSSPQRGKATPSKKFVKPTREEVGAYASSIGYKLDPGIFIDHYEARGWMIGRNPMKSWQAAVRTWKQRENERRTTSHRGNGSRQTLGEIYDDLVGSGAPAPAHPLLPGGDQ